MICTVIGPSKFPWHPRIGNFSISQQMFWFQRLFEQWHIIKLHSELLEPTPVLVDSCFSAEADLGFWKIYHLLVLNTGKNVFGYGKEMNISPFCYISSKKYIVCVIITDVYQVSESYIPRKGGFQRLENRGYMHARCPLLGHGIPELITRLANCGCGRSVSWWHLESRFAAERLSHWLGWLAEKYSISWKISRLKWLK